MRELKRKSWLAAKRSPGRRFHALFDRIYRRDVLKEAWRRVQKNEALTGRGRLGTDIREVISRLNPILRGWGNYFRTGNAATRSNQIASYVLRRRRDLMFKRHGRDGRPRQTAIWTREWFEAHGLHGLRGTIRYPVSAS